MPEEKVKKEAPETEETEKDEESEDKEQATKREDDTISFEAWVQKVKSKKTFVLLDLYGKDLYDLDCAIELHDNILKTVAAGGVRPVVDFTGVEKIHSYWLLLSIGQLTIKWKDRTNEIVGLVGLNRRNLSLLNLVAKEARENGKEVLKGIKNSNVQDDLN